MNPPENVASRDQQPNVEGCGDSTPQRLVESNQRNDGVLQIPCEELNPVQCHDQPPDLTVAVYRPSETHGDVIETVENNPPFQPFPLTYRHIIWSCYYCRRFNTLYF